MNPTSPMGAADTHMRLVQLHKTAWYKAYIKRFWETYYEDNASPGGNKVAMKLMDSENNDLMDAGPGSWSIIYRQLLHQLADAETVFVTADICHVVQMMAKSMPADMLMPEDPPFKNAFYVFETDIPYEEWDNPNQVMRPTAIRAVLVNAAVPVRSWGDSERRSGISTTLFAAIDVMVPEKGPTGDLAMMEMTGWQYEQWWKMAPSPNHRSKHEISPHVGAFRKFLLCLFRFMQEEIIEVQREKLPRPALRRMARADFHIPEDGSVTKVRLRKVRKVGTQEHESTDVVWSHRWWVAGHKRHLDYLEPGRTTWVRPHLKGPEHAPIVMKEKVIVVDR